MNVLTKSRKTTKARKALNGIKRSSPARITINSGPKLMKWRQERGIPRTLFAQMADFSERTLASVERASRLPKTAQRPVTETVRLIRALEDLAGDRAALKTWLEQRNPAFGNKTPLKLITGGESDALWRMVHQLRQGSYQ